MTVLGKRAASATMGGAACGAAYYLECLRQSETAATEEKKRPRTSDL
jgi:hypothetical protein